MNINFGQSDSDNDNLYIYNKFVCVWQYCGKALYKTTTAREILPMLAQLGALLFLVFAVKAIRLYCSIHHTYTTHISISIYTLPIALALAYIWTQAHTQIPIYRTGNQRKLDIIWIFLLSERNIGHKMLMVLLEMSLFDCLLLANSGLPHIQ